MDRPDALKAGEKVWVIYDERAWSSDVDDCAVMEAGSFDDIKEADLLQYRDRAWPNCPIYEYTATGETDEGLRLVDKERLVG
jgi:hypothetical protein